MKKLKLLFPICTAAALAGGTIPLVSCAKNQETLGNLMTEYIPTIARKERVSENLPIDIVDAYLTDVNDNGDIFAQDFIYTLSRGLPQYAAYISEFCEITKHDYNVNVHDVSVDFDNQTITFRVDLHTYYDYSETEEYELLWYEMPYKVWDATTTIEMVFDFNTSDEAGYDTTAIPFAQMKQMTTFAGATQFGICERNSTMKVIKQSGYAITLEDERIDVSSGIESDALHFMIPSEGYWSSSEYLTRMTEVYRVWYEMPGAQVIVLLFKYYMPSNVLSIANIPSTLDFGSYYMGNATLNDTYRIIDNAGETTLYGFNKSLDSARNLEHIEADEEKYVDGTLTLPDANIISAYAFSGDACIYTNMGIPLGVQKVVIPASCYEIKGNAFTGNPALVGFKSLKLNPNTSGKPLTLNRDSFNQLLSLEEIDFSSFPAAYAKSMLESADSEKWDGAFTNVHLGAELLQEGKIILANDCQTDDINAWIELLGKAGLKAYVPIETEVKEGWAIELAPQP